MEMMEKIHQINIFEEKNTQDLDFRKTHKNVQELLKLLKLKFISEYLWLIFKAQFVCFYWKKLSKKYFSISQLTYLQVLISIKLSFYSPVTTSWTA